MTSRIDPWLLGVRAVAVGTVAYFLGVAGHVTADGLLPGPGVLLALLGFTVVMSAPLLDRVATRLRLVTMLVVGQTGIHLVLSVTGGHTGDAPASAAASPPAPRGTGAPLEAALPVTGGRRTGSLDQAYAATLGQGPDGVAPSLPVGHLVGDLTAHAPMMLAHLAAAALVALWLAHGERLLWSVIALSGRRLLLVVARQAPALGPLPSLPRSAPADLAVARLRSRWSARAWTRRGPPLPA